MASERSRSMGKGLIGRIFSIGTRPTRKRRYAIIEHSVYSNVSSSWSLGSLENGALGSRHFLVLGYFYQIKVASIFYSLSHGLQSIDQRVSVM